MGNVVSIAMQGVYQLICASVRYCSTGLIKYIVLQYTATNTNVGQEKYIYDNDNMEKGKRYSK